MLDSEHSNPTFLGSFGEIVENWWAQRFDWEYLLAAGQSPAQMRRHLTSKSSHNAELRLCAVGAAISLQGVVEW